jgi:ABC-2 type transport system ATP-binding protein
MIELTNVSKTFKVAQRQKGLGSALKSLFKRSYKYIKALDNVSFKINEGEIVGYIGPNGAGKSTTIKIMSGILVPDSGECTILGYTPWKERQKYVENIGVVFGQRTQLWWDVPIIDSFELLKDIYKVSDRTYQETLEMLVESMSLKEFLYTPLRQVSLGQRMRAEIAASLLHNPKILFLDEPTIGLDAVSKLAVRSFIKTINRERRLTVILTTHDMNDIEALTDRIILIGKGKILYDGSMDLVKKRFDTYRLLRITYEHAIDPIIPPNCTLESWDEHNAVLRLDTKTTTVSEVMGFLTPKIDILDLTAENPPLEEIIASLYSEHGI